MGRCLMAPFTDELSRSSGPVCSNQSMRALKSPNMAANSTRATWAPMQR